MGSVESIVLSSLNVTTSRLITPIYLKKGRLPSTHGIQRVDESPQLILRQLFEPLLHRVRDRSNGVEQLQSRRRDPRGHMPTVVRIPLPTDEPGFFEPLQQARNVRDSVDHPLADLSAAEPGVARSAENPQHIELGPGQAERTKCFIRRVIEQCSRAKQPQDRLMLQAGERLVLQRPAYARL